MLLSSPLFSCPVTPLPSLFSTDTLAALFRIILPPKPALPICGQKKLNTEAIGNHGNLATSVNLNTPCYQGATFSPSISSRVPYLVSTPPPSTLLHTTSPADQPLSQPLSHIPPLLIIPLSSIFPLSHYLNIHHHPPHRSNLETIPCLSAIESHFGGKI